MSRNTLEPYYQDDYCTIYHGDCLKILPQLTETVDLVLTDPPYGIDFQPPRGLTNTIQGDKRGEAEELLRCLCEWMENLPEDTAHFVFAGWSETWVQEMLREYLTVKSAIVWAKNKFGIGYHTRPQYDLIYLVHKGEPAPPEQPESDVWHCPKVENLMHSCEKPLALIKRCIVYYDTAQVVLDPFMGSGTTLRAAKDLGRKAIGIEIEEKYCEIAVDRLRQEVLAF